MSASHKISALLREMETPATLSPKAGCEASDLSGGPLVSVIMLTYNHANYITESIESVLMQQTRFPVELIIGEDCSTDDTRRIVEYYGKAYPGKIRAVCHEKNLGSRLNGQMLRSMCRGRYVAVLEGDDYWTDPGKLQKQVDFLESHPDCSICCSRFTAIQGDGSNGRSYPSPSHPQIGSLEDILRWNYILTCTVMYRRECRPELPPVLQGLYHGDMCAWVLLAERGRVGFIDEVTAVYRLHAGGVWTGLSVERRIAELEKTINGIHQYLNNRYPGIHRASLCIRYVECARQYEQAGESRNAARWMLKALAKSPVTFVTLKDAWRSSAVCAWRLGLAPVQAGWNWVQTTFRNGRIIAGRARRKLLAGAGRQGGSGKGAGVSNRD